MDFYVCRNNYIAVTWTCCMAVTIGGASGARPPHLKSVPPHFTFGPLVATYIHYCIFKMWPLFWFLAPPSGFWPPLLLNPGDGFDLLAFLAVIGQNVQ